MLDSLFILADGTGPELSWGSIIGSIATALSGAGVGLKLLWSYWVKREEEKRAAWKGVVDGKDEIIKLKDERIEAFSKALSKKSDEHAAKIQELMGLTLGKVEEWSAKQERLLDRALTVQAEFTAEVRKLNLDPGGGRSVG